MKTLLYIHHVLHMLLVPSTLVSKVNIQWMLFLKKELYNFPRCIHYRICLHGWLKAVCVGWRFDGWCTPCCQTVRTLLPASTSRPSSHHLLSTWCSCCREHKLQMHLPLGHLKHHRIWHHDGFSKQQTPRCAFETQSFLTGSQVVKSCMRLI